MRKVKYLVAALLLMGATTTFTSCIDNDEPAGITDLRGAKAELIRAKAAVETARVAYVEAQTRWANAEAEAKEIQNKRDDLKYQKEQATTEAEIARIQAELEINKLNWENWKINAQMELDKTKKEYEDLQEYLAAADNVLNGYEQQLLSDAKTQLQEAYNYMEKAHSLYIGAQDDLNTAYINYDEETIKAGFERQLELKKFELAGLEKVVSEYQAQIEKDYGTADWEAEIKSLTDSIAKLELKRGSIVEEQTKYVNSDEYRAAEQAVNTTKNKLDNAKVEEEYKYEIPSEIVTDFKTKIGQNYADAYVVAEGSKSYFKVAKGAKATSSDPAKPATAQDLAGILEIVDARIEDFNSEWDAVIDGADETAKANLEAAKKSYEAAVTAWKNATTKYNNAKGFDGAAYDKIVKTAVDVIDKNYAIAIKPGTTETEKAANVAALNAIASALVTYYNAVDAKVGLTTNEVTLEITNPVGDPAKVKKTILAWLSDATYSGIYLKKIGMQSDVASFKKYYIADYGKTSGAVKSMGSEDTIYEALVAASDAAFGKRIYYYSDVTISAANKNEYLLVQPTLDEVRVAIAKAEAENATLTGAAVAVVDAEDAIAATTDKATYKEGYVALKAALETELTTILNHVEDLQDAYDKAVADFDKFKANKDAYTAKAQAVQGVIDALMRIKGQLQNLVNLALPGGSGNESTEQLVAWLTAQLDTAKANVIAKEKEIADLEKQLAQVEDGTYNQTMYIEYYKQAVEFAKSVYEEAQTLYADALVRLQEVVAALTNSSESAE